MLRRVSILLLSFIALSASLHAQTSISLTLASVTIAAGTPAVVTASLSTAGAPVTGGEVDFFDGSRLAGTVQVVRTASAGYTVGTATLRRLFGSGMHTLKATYRGTVAHPTADSNTATLIVTGIAAKSPDLHFTDISDLTRDGAWNFLSDFKLADLNNDGVYDLFALQFDTATGVTALADRSHPAHYTSPSYLGGGFLVLEAENAVTADLNGDGLLDLVFLRSDNSIVRIFLATAPGVYGPETVLNSGTGFVLGTICIKDVNHDGLPDIVGEVGTNQNGTRVVVWLNDPAHPGTFQALNPTVVSSIFAFTFSVADLNGDGLPDLLISNLTTAVDVVLNDPANPGKSWLPAQRFDLTENCWHVRSVDLNEDGVPDLVAGAYSGNLVVALGDAAHPGSFLPAKSIAPPPTMQGIVAAYFDFGDLHGDGHTDIVVADTGQHFTVFQGDGTGNFAPGPAYITSPTPLNFRNAAFAWENTQLAVKDIDGDGLDDVVLSELRQNTVQVYRHIANPNALILTATDISANAYTFAPGQPIVLTALETAFTGTMSGNVDFQEFGPSEQVIPIASAPIVNGVATLTIPNPSPGFHNYVARFAGDSTFATSESAIIDVYVRAAPNSSLALQSSLNPAAFHQPVTFTAIVTITNGVGTPTGSITFYDGITVLGVIATSTGSASFTTATLTPGTHSISASYSGDGNNPAAASSTLLQQITEMAAGITLTAGSPTTIQTGGQVTVNAVVTPVSTSSAPSPTGTVTFFSGPSSLGTATLDATGHASLAPAFPVAGTFSITATYQGDSNYAPAVSGAIVVTVVNPAAPTVTSLTVTPNPGVQGGIETLSAHVASADVGSVSFYEGGTLLGTSAVSSAGDASLQQSFAPGIHTLTAQYLGATQFAPSTSASVSLKIAIRDFQVAMSTLNLGLPTRHHAPIDVIVKSIGGFTDDITFDCANLPIYASCNFDIHTVHLAANGAATAHIMLDTDAVLNYAGNTRSSSAPLLCGLPIILWAAFRKRRRVPYLLAFAFAVTLIQLTGCTGKLPGHTPPGTYAVQVTAKGKSSGVTHSASWTLIVADDN